MLPHGRQKPARAYMAPPYGQGKIDFGNSFGCSHIYGVSLVWQRPDGLRAFGPRHFIGVYRHALKQVFRKQVRAFFHRLFPWQPSGKRYKNVWRAACARLIQKSRIASGMTNAGLCRKFVLCALSQKTPGNTGSFVGQPHTGTFCPASCDQVRQPLTVPTLRHSPDGERAQHGPGTVYQQSAYIFISAL